MDNFSEFTVTSARKFSIDMKFLFGTFFPNEAKNIPPGNSDSLYFPHTRPSAWTKQDFISGNFALIRRYGKSHIMLNNNFLFNKMCYFKF